MDRTVIDLSSDDEDVVMDDAAHKEGQGGDSELEELGFDPFQHDDLLWDGDFDIPLPPSPGLDAEQDDLLQLSADVNHWHQILDVDDAVREPDNQNPPQFDVDVDFVPNIPANKQPTDAVRESAPFTEIPGKRMCISGVVELFPDICHDHVAKLYAEYVGRKTVENIVDLILQSAEEGDSYPKTKRLKRKRAPEDDKEDQDEEARKYTSVGRAAVTHDYRVLVRAILSGEFCYTPMQYIDYTLSVSKYHLYPAYQTLEEIERTWNPQVPTYQKLKHPRKANRFYGPGAVEDAIKSPSTTPDLLLSLTELRAARMARARKEQNSAAELMTAQAEKENVAQAKRDGTMQDCSCCYTETPLNRMVVCSSETELHSFCKECPRAYAETQVGQGKHELICFSTETCKGTFSNDQRKLFLDEKLTIAIDRIEAEAALRLAGIENLESCPFCPFAAEYPPVEETKLFHCQNESCYIISCRLCKKESHIPKSCEEFAKENGLSVRRQIEEAMTSALVRACNKCKTPFIKDEGCNKMSCKCGNVQCYVCSESCSYDHFNDVSRGGKSGNCPLFDDVEKRHTEEVQKAAKDVLAKVRAEHPEYTEEDLEIKVSDNVKNDEEVRKKRHVQPRLPANFLEYERHIQAAPLNHVVYGHGNAQYAVDGRFAYHGLFEGLPANVLGDAGVNNFAAYDAAFRRRFDIDAPANPPNPAPNPAQPAARLPMVHRMMQRLAQQREAPAPAPAPAQAPAPAPAQVPRNAHVYAMQFGNVPAPRRRAAPAPPADDFGDADQARVRGALRRRDAEDAQRKRVRDGDFGVPQALEREASVMSLEVPGPVAGLGLGEGRPRRGARVERVRRRVGEVAGRVVGFVLPGGRRRER